MPSAARPEPRPEPRPDPTVAREDSAVFAFARPVLLELGAVGASIPWLPGARRWRAERAPLVEVADLGEKPLVELAFRLGDASEWAMVVGPGGAAAASRLFLLAEVRFACAIVIDPLAFVARTYADRVFVARSDRERWAAACEALRVMGAATC